MLLCLMASIQFRLCRRVLRETRMKSKHAAGMRAWDIALIKQQLPLSFFQHSILPQLFLCAEFWDCLVVHWAYWHRPHTSPRVHRPMSSGTNTASAQQPGNPQFPHLLNLLTSTVSGWSSHTSCDSLPGQQPALVHLCPSQMKQIIADLLLWWLLLE